MQGATRAGGRGSRTPLFLLAAALFLACGALQSPARAPRPQAGTETRAVRSAPLKAFQSQKERFEFSYPEDYILDPHTSPDGGFIFALMKKPNTGWLIDIDFQDSASYPAPEYDPSRISFQEFGIRLAKLRCDADGPDGSQYCTEVVKRRPFTNPQGLEAVELYLTEVQETFEPAKKEKRVKGPIYALLISSGPSFRVLSFEPTEDGQEVPAIRKVLLDIADSVKVLR